MLKAVLSKQKIFLKFDLLYANEMSAWLWSSRFFAKNQFYELKTFNSYRKKYEIVFNN